MKLSVRNWDRFQHYSKRRPPWVKLHTEILDEFDHDGNPKKFRALPDNAKLTFFCLIALASRYRGGVIPTSDPRWLARETGISEAAICVKPLLECGYLECGASTALAERKRTSENMLLPEGERETEKERETEADTEPRARKMLAWKFGSIPDMTSAIRSCFPAMFEQSIEGALRSCPPEAMPALSRQIERWCHDQANAVTPLSHPLSSLRKAVARAAGGDPDRVPEKTDAQLRRERAKKAGDFE